MHKAKDELYQLAKDSYQGNLPFGNPVKDYGQIENYGGAELLSNVEADGVSNFGYLDHFRRSNSSFACF